MLRERHNLKHRGKSTTLKIGDVVIIKSDDKSRAKWPLGIVQELYPGRDGIIRAVRLRAGQSYLERPIQHLYPLELACDVTHPNQPILGWMQAHLSSDQKGRRQCKQGKRFKGSLEARRNNKSGKLEQSCIMYMCLVTFRTVLNL